MKKTYHWKWNGKYIPVNRLHYNQLFTILKGLNSNKIKDTGVIKSEEWKNVIKKELQIRSQRDTKEVFKMIEKQRVKKAKNTVKQLVKQFSNAKIF